ncbi:hypothetical protein L596_013706 [Steinernema carpocapsae]|uniref:G-protein coupled receptors family 1 profile domain-containing protein n=1 Tax=Steinernema carpocapsae TaxID=34508 RepID=A0A4U5P0Z1_STECR|nr:hypothetical protein L596_013706 [Steinernema carpocapsae]
MANSPAPLDARLIGGCVLFIASVLGLFGNLTLIAVSIKNFATFRKTAFFIITWQLLIGDIMVILPELVIPIPIIFAGYGVHGASVFAMIMANMDTVGFMCNQYFALLLILNRFCIFCFPQLNGILFGRRSVLVTAIIFWLYIFGRTLFTVLAGCVKLFDSNYFFFKYNCTNAIGVAKKISQWTKYESYYLPGVMFFSFTLLSFARFIMSCGLSLVKLGTKTGNKKLRIEKKLLIQSILICGMLQIESLSFAIVSKIKIPAPGSYYLSFLTSLIVIANSSIHPFVLFTFNTDATGIKKLLEERNASQELISVHAQLR